jgi:hypothetical protein
MDYYVPFCQRSPLLTITAIYTAECSLEHWGNAVILKNQAIRLFNNNLLSHSRNSDETIATLTQLIQNEWYWGAYRGEGMDLGNHLRLLNTLVYERGGFRRLGLHGLIAKLAIT